LGDPYQTSYWNRAGRGKRFSHPLDREFLVAQVPPATRILDVGCGYGRSLTELRELGYREVVGVDTSAAMLGRGRAPDLDLRLVSGPPLPFADASFGLVLLFAVLTSIPSLERQASVLDEIERLLAPGGRVMVSDLMLQPDARNRRRYAAYGGDLGYGCFEADDGALFRHHDEAWLAALAARWEAPTVRRVRCVTMNGNPVECLQLIGRKRG